MIILNTNANKLKLKLTTTATITLTMEKNQLYESPIPQTLILITTKTISIKSIKMWKRWRKWPLKKMTSKYCRMAGNRFCS